MGQMHSDPNRYCQYCPTIVTIQANPYKSWGSSYPVDLFFIRITFIWVQQGPPVIVLIFFLKLVTTYTAGWYVWWHWVLAVNHLNHQNFEKSLLSYKCGLIFVGMKEKKCICLKKWNSKWPTQKKVIFQNRQFSIFFCENFMERSLG